MSEMASRCQRVYPGFDDMGPLQSILAERQRQAEIEGFTPAHDDCEDAGQMLAVATAFYRHAVVGIGTAACRSGGCPADWPWEAAWWKPKSRSRDLERAGALVVAERERVLRISSTASVVHCDDFLAEIIDALAVISNADPHGKAGVDDV